MAKKILVIQPAPELLSEIERILRNVAPSAKLTVISRAEDVGITLATAGPVDLLVTEAYLEGIELLELLYEYRLANPKVPVVVATSYDLSSYEEYLTGLPQVSLPLEDGFVDTLFRQALGIMQGQVWPPYQIGKYVGPDRWGECFEAVDTAVNRPVYLTILKADADDDEIAEFNAAASYMAKAGHPNATSVFVAGSYSGRHYFAREYWNFENLYQKVEAGERIEPRFAARIIHTVVSVLHHWETRGIGHRGVTAADVSLSPQGLVKIENLADPRMIGQKPDVSQLEEVSIALKRLLPPIDELPLRLRQLLNEMRSDGAQLHRLLSEAQTVDTELTPERNVEVTKEHVEAEKLIAREKRREKMIFYAQIAAFLALIVIVGYFIIDRLLPKDEYTQFKKMIEIPAGEGPYQDTKATTETFWIDEYPVTIWQYYRFLRETEGMDMKPYEHPDLQGKKKDHTPSDWESIINSIKYKRPYAQQMITLDCPVFNIDFYDAYAYAAYKGRRLPTEQEWEKAARGPQGYLYPYGNKFDPTRANTGADFKHGRPKDSGHLDGAYSWSPVNFKEGDVSPYGVKDMGGNVSEWTSTMTTHAKLSSMQAPVVKGGNFILSDENQLKMTHRIRTEATRSRQPWIGFRTVSDAPPKE
jgi:formylglycine-generating enzyme required for sulfatase activity